MAKSKKEQYEQDPADGLVRAIVGAWSVDKHQRLQRYVFASHGARRRFRDDYRKETSFIDLYCGPGRARIKDSYPEKIIDGSSIAAAKAASTSTPYDRYFIGDLDEGLVSACAQRLACIDGCTIEPLTGNAEETAAATISKLHRGGLHFAFIDPFNADLPFSVLATLGELNHMDLLIHFSIMDLSRNLNAMKQDGRLDELAPGWTSAINIKMGIDEQRMGIFKHWRGLLENKLKYSVSDKIVKVRGPNRAEIYWLVFASRHDLGGKLWKEIADLNPQPQHELF